MTYKEPTIMARTSGSDASFQMYTISHWDQVGDIGSVRHVNTLHFQDCSLPDMGPMLGLPDVKEVTTLGIMRCDFESWDAIGSFPSLQRICIHNSTLHAMPDVPVLEKVVEVWVNGNPIESLVGMDKFPNVEILNVDSTPITSFEGLEGCPNVKTISARFCTSLGSLRGLQNARRLEKLDLSMLGIAWGGNIREPGRLTSLRGLGNCARLVEVDARGHRIETLAGLDGCGALQTINVAHNNIARIDGVEPLSSLHRLFLDHNPLATLEGIEPMRNRLGVLGIDNTPVRSLEPLRDFKTLAYLHARGTAIESLEPLRNCTNLRKLDITNTNVSSLQPLKEIYTLTSLDAANCRLTSIWGLPRSDMNHVDVTGNPMHSDEIERFLV